ncbi:MAG TPA: patatin-like phospholipase family protein [Rhodanobacteraceae bacterium]
MTSPPTRDVRTLLRRTAVFGHLQPQELDALLDEMAWLWLPGHAPLYLRGEPSDALYVLLSGSLGVFGVPRIGGAPRMLGVIAAGKTLGEVGLISGDVRTHGVRALRDSELLRLSREGFEKLTKRHPLAMLGAARVALQALHRDEKTSPARTFALLPFDGASDAHALAEALQRQLARWGQCVIVDAAVGRDRGTDWFTACEADASYVLYVGDGDAAWQRLCQRQADALLLLVESARPAANWPRDLEYTDRWNTAGASSSGTGKPLYARPWHLILHHPRGGFVAGAAHAWRARLRNDQLDHHHWRHPGDIARLARLLSGHSTGLVLSGGGARGFAQIGVVQALREHGIEIDSVVGTSVGAIIGGGVAAEWDDGLLRANCWRTMVEGKPLSDWTLPLVALTRGARTTQLLRETFGEVDIEDLPVPYACVSSDLTDGVMAIHREGLLWRWVRASVALPGVLPPLFHQGHVYVDGGVINNLPTDVLADASTGRIIAVDISSDDTLRAGVDEAASPPLPTLWAERRRQHHRPSMFAILVRAGMVNSETASAQRRELADLLLRPDMREIGMFDWRKFGRAVEIGYQCARTALREAAAATVPPQQA